MTKKFYCYLENGKPIISEKKPERFDHLKYNYRAFCPNMPIAKMTYEANLKIRGWRGEYAS